MQPTNPFTFFVDNSTTQEFTYIPGDTPFYVRMLQGRFVMISAVIFSNSQEQVRQILRELVAFQAQCRRMYDARAAFTDSRSAIYYELQRHLSNQPTTSNLQIEPVQKYRALKVAWAANDTI